MKRFFLRVPRAAEVFSVCFLALFLLLAAKPVLAVPECGPFNVDDNSGSCLSGIASMASWNSSNRRWSWTCQEGRDSVNCFSSNCGNGVRDDSEECDGNDLPGGSNQCSVYNSNYVSGILTCSADCRLNTSDCATEVNPCGNNILDEARGEQCDLVNGRPVYADGITNCETAGQGYGEISCDNCSVNYRRCAKCGNTRVETYDIPNPLGGYSPFAEQCDNSNLNNQTCQRITFPNLPGYSFTNGNLACYTDYLPGGQVNLSAKKCTFDTSRCEGPAICGNGKKDVDEECDGGDFGGLTCSSLGCDVSRTEALICDSNCQVARDADGFPTGCKRPCFARATSTSSCLATNWSDWADFPLTANSYFAKPCAACGLANDKWYDEDEKPSSELCGAFDDGNTNPIVREVLSSSGQLDYWEWRCGETQCYAYPNPKCRIDLTKQGDPCDPEGPNSIFLTKSDYFNKANERGVFVEQNERRFCDIGLPSSYASIEYPNAQTYPGYCGYDYKAPDNSAWNPNYNSGWTCSKTKKYSNTNEDRLKTVNCSVGWGDNGVCGNKNNGEYYVPAPTVAQSTCTNDAFFGLKSAPANPDLCGTDSTPIIEGYSRESGKIVFKWQCEWRKNLPNFGPGNSLRKGTKVDCKASLNGICESDSVRNKPVCGNDIFKKFPDSTGSLKPGAELCFIGTSTIPGYNSQTATWAWNCNIGTSSLPCSVTERATCGLKDSSALMTESQIRAATPCLKGRLKDNVINNFDDEWTWQCEDPEDEGIMVDCSLSKCGTANGKNLTDNLWNNIITNNIPGQLCGISGRAVNINAETNNLKRTWQCSYPGLSGSRDTIVDCYAKRVSCGEYNNRTVSPYDVDRSARLTATSLCTRGDVVNLRETDRDLNGDGVISRYNDYVKGAWNWQCRGSYNGQIDLVSCQAEKAICGDANNKSLTKTQFDYLKTSEPFHLCGGSLTAGNFVEDSLGNYVNWDCFDSLGTKLVNRCYATFADCGLSVDWDQTLTTNTVLNFKNSSTQRNMVCSPGTKSISGLDIILGNKTLNWTCDGDDVASNDLATKNNKKKCSVNHLRCDPFYSTGSATEVEMSRNCSEGGTIKLCSFGCENEDEFVSDITGNRSPGYYTYQEGYGNVFMRFNVRSVNFNFPPNAINPFFDTLNNRWKWYCKDSYNGLSEPCYLPKRNN
ncbi:MAG: hypothetical protein PHR00_01720 [Patescibacteria group bacterium]|nr:hypothetical protein [Patescibacteria group bacterium]